MKKLLLIFGTFAIICVIISSYAQAYVQVDNVSGQVSESASFSDDTVYVVKSENGRIVVYENEELLYRTNTAVNTLPKKDQKTLLYGLSANSKEEVRDILEEYCS